MSAGWSLWLHTLVGVMLLASAVELLLPDGSAKSTGRAALGLLVLLTVLRPVLAWLQQPVPWSAVLSSSSAATEGVGGAGDLATASAYREVVARMLTSLVWSEPGARGAEVDVTFAPAPTGQPPSVQGVRITLLGPASAEERQHMVQAVSSALGIDPSAVSIQG